MNIRLKWFQMIVWLELGTLLLLFFGALFLPAQIALIMAQSRHSLILDVFNPLPLVRMLGIATGPSLVLCFLIVANDPRKRQSMARGWVTLHFINGSFVVLFLNGLLPLIVWFGLACLLFASGILQMFLLESGLNNRHETGSIRKTLGTLLRLLRTYVSDAFHFLRTRRWLMIGSSASLFLLAVVSVTLWMYLKPRHLVPTVSNEEHFKYAPLGKNPGIPYEILRVLPEVFGDLLPGTNSWGDFGMTVEPGHELPVGLAIDTRRIKTVTFNCALRHVSTYRTSETAPQIVVPGGPAHQLELDHFIKFLIACGEDPRFRPDILIPAMEADHPMNWLERNIYRTVAIPGTQFVLQAAKQEMMWMRVRPDCGRGRIDAFNVLKFNILRLPEDATIGTSDYLPVWNQRAREGMRFHWDGSGSSVEEANHISVLAVVFSPDFADNKSIMRVCEYLLDLPAPAFPFPIDQAQAQEGAEIFQRDCAHCHAMKNSLAGQITPLSLVQTDPEYLSVMTPLLASYLDDYHTPPFDFAQIDLSAGYLNVPLDGCWLRAPYLHNGSVPTLWALLHPVEDRPARFFRGHDVYDPEHMGFHSTQDRAGFVGSDFSVRVRGNSNRGHLFGTELSDAEKWALIEYLKTL